MMILPHGYPGGAWRGFDLELLLRGSGVISRYLICLLIERAYLCARVKALARHRKRDLHRYGPSRIEGFLIYTPFTKQNDVPEPGTLQFTTLRFGQSGYSAFFPFFTVSDPPNLPSRTPEDHSGPAVSEGLKHRGNGISHEFVGISPGHTRQAT